MDRGKMINLTISLVFRKGKEQENRNE